MSDEAAFDCRTCGACCAYGLHIDLEQLGDVERLPPKYQLRVIQHEGAACSECIDSGFHDHDTYPMLPNERTTNGKQCIALRGDVMVRVACDIYEHRPDACRGFQPGSRKCLQAREAQIQFQAALAQHRLEGAASRAKLMREKR